jgi:hypothetical protein
VATVPPVDLTGLGNASSNDRVNAIELRLLDAGAKAKENLNREADQRYWLRWGAVGGVAAAMLIMAFLLYHISHSMPIGPLEKIPGAFLVALFVAPIVSLTTLAVSLLVAAFRGFKESDGTVGMSAATEGFKAVAGGK